MRMRVVGPVVIILFALVSCAAAAQQEQWLRYAASVHPDYRIVGTADARPETNPPNAADLPQFKGDKPVFFRWKLGSAIAAQRKMKDDFVWVALDQSAKGGAYDLLLIDTNLDGRLADETAIKIGMDESSGDPCFPLVEMTLSAEDGPVAYHLNVRPLQDGAAMQVRFEAACRYDGTVTIGGEQFLCTLLDGDADGQFNETAANPYQADVIRLVPAAQKERTDMLTDGTMHAVGAYVEIRDKLYALDVSPDGACVKFTPAPDAPTGKIRVGKDVTELSVAGKEGHFYLRPKDGLVTVPAGEYVVYRWKISRTDAKGGRWQFTGTNASFKETLSVRKGKEISLDVGEPITSEMRITKDWAGYSISPSHMFKGRSGEDVTLLCNDQSFKPGEVRITNADGSYEEILTFAYG